MEKLIKTLKFLEVQILKNQRKALKKFHEGRAENPYNLIIFFLDQKFISKITTFK